MKKLARLLAFLSLAAAALHYLRVQSARMYWLALPKLLAQSFAAFVAALGALGTILGALSGAPAAVLAGLAGMLSSWRYLHRVTAPHDGFERAFGADWERKIAPERRTGLLPRRWTWRLPAAPEPRWERDVIFGTAPGTDRHLLCDVWQPPVGVPATGLAFLYCHGSAWHYLDKDFGTRPFFRHLAAQGHVVMDIAYRLCPETDLNGMLGDVKRAVAWMKDNGPRYGVDPARLVLAGGSAGAHLALLAAYTPCHPALTPADLVGRDLRVCAVVSYYGPTDTRAVLQHAGRVLAPNRAAALARRNTPAGRVSAIMMRPLLGKLPPGQDILSGVEDMARNLLGAMPVDRPDLYELATPTTHVGPGTPPTLLFQGDHDLLVPVESTRALYARLAGAGVPAVYVEFPQTEHGFDLVAPAFSPAGQAALYDVDRFLALMASWPGV